ncbi:MAG: MATE family efflux transporter [Oscillospiraceae bacterium]|nr:MATE family efflux transporter [Oscillospiraceae bacterium]
MIKDKTFYRSLLAIAVPIALQNIIGFGVQMLDTIMVGSLGDTALSAASLANQPFFVFMIFSFGLASGGSVLIAQYWGRGNTDVVRRVMGISMRCVALASVLFATLCYAFPLQIMDIFSNEPDVIEAGASYLRVVVFSYVFYGVSNCYLTALRGVENVKLATGVYGVSFFVNAFFNYAFIFGKFGFPELGLVGAACGTVIARISEFLIVLLYSSFIEKKIGFKLRMLFQSERELWSDFIRHSLPVVGSELVWSLGSVTQAAIIGNIGSIFVSANSIASVAQQLAMVMMFGVGNAAAVLMGKTIGAGRAKEAKTMGRTFLVLALGVGLLSCGIILLLRTPMLGFYRVSDETKKLAFEIMGVMSFIMLFAPVETTCIVGILRGAGDTRFAFAVDAGCTWLIGVPMGFLAGFVWKLPVLWVYVFLRSDVFVRIALCLTRVLRGNYIKNVTRDI